MWTYNYLDELCHHGVLGMHWGKRTPRKVYKTPKAQDFIFKKHASQNIERRIQEKGMSRTASIAIETAKGIAITGLVYYGSRKLGSLIGSEVTGKGQNVTEDMLNSNFGGIYSKSLGRLLTAEEMIERGL